MRISSSIRQRFLFTLTLAVITLFGAFATLSVALEQQSEGAALINIAGRQRMLSQRIGWLTFNYVNASDISDVDFLRAELTSALNLFESSHEALISGGVVATLDGDEQLETLTEERSEAIQAIYFSNPINLDADVDRYVGAVNNILDTPAVFLDAENSNLQLITSLGQNELLADLDLLTRTLQLEQDAQVGNFQFWQLVAGGLASLVFILLLYFVLFVPAVEQIEEQGERLEELEASNSVMSASIQAQSSIVETASAIAKNFGTTFDPNELIRTSVNLIQEKFNLYYVQVYLADNTGNRIYLNSGSGVVGEELVARGHRLPIGSGSINGLAAASQDIVFVPDVTSDPFFRANPYLPRTRMEMALPLVANDQLIGVLNLQDIEGGLLQKDIIPVFEALAGQMAMALNNLYQFNEVLQAYEAYEARAKAETKHSWENYFKDQKNGTVEYTYVEPQFEMKHERDGIQPALLNTVVQKPIEIANLEVGQLIIEGESSVNLREPEHRLIENVTSQVAQRIENIRLLEDSERYRLEAERAIRRLTEETWQEYADGEESLSSGALVFDGKQIVENGSLEGIGETILKTALQVQGQEIGDIQIVGDNARVTNPQALIDTISQNLSVHIENLRLNQQTEVALAEAQRQSREMAAINRIIAQATQAHDVNVSLQVVADELSTIIESDQIGIAMLDEDGEHLTIVAARAEGRDHEDVLGIKIPVEGNESTQRVIETRGMLVIEDAQNNPMTDQVHDLMRMRRIKTLVLLPILGEGSSVIGTVGIDIREDMEDLNANQLRLAETIVYQTSTVLQNANLLTKLQVALDDTAQQAQRLAKLNQLSSEFGSALSLEDVFRTAGKDVNHIIGGFRTRLSLRTAEDENIVTVYHLDPHKGMVDSGERYEVSGATAVGASMLTQEIMIISDTTDHPTIDAQAAAQENVHSMMVAPLITQNGVIGAFHVECTTFEAFGDVEENLMLQTTSLLASTIENRQLLRETQKRADREQLVNNITQKIQSTVTIESALQTTIQEIGKALQARNTRIAIKPLTKANPGSNSHNANGSA